MAGDGVVGDRAGDDTLGLKLVRRCSSPLPFSCCKDIDVDAGLTTVSEDGELCGCNRGKAYSCCGGMNGDICSASATAAALRWMCAAAAPTAPPRWNEPMWWQCWPS